MNALERVYYTARAVGWDNLPRRAWQILKGRLGITRQRLPGGELSAEALRRQFVDNYVPDDALSHWQARAARFFFAPEQRDHLATALKTVVDDSVWADRVAQVVEKARHGHLVFFNRFFADVGNPPRFNYDPIHRAEWPIGRHWSTYGQFHPDRHDLKCVWEASRFAWAYHLARHYLRQHDAAVADLYWRLFDEWDRQNPYGLTPQWACGQEGTFRMFAWLFCAFAMLPADSRRLHRLTELVWYTARHIERNINYARGQKNNHALSEAAGLLTLGLLFPELRRASAWHTKGRNVLENDLQRQIYADGSYVQHSLNYHRVMLDDVLWAARLAELHGEPLSDGTLACTARALKWLLEMIEPETGRVPNYGANDGALVLPLSTCDYLDFRPVAQAVHYLLHRERCFPPGPWDEKMLWLFGTEALDAPTRLTARSPSFAAPAGGYFTLAGPRSWGMVRCHSYRDRPAQADMLHFDLWLRRLNVLRDAGSYHYYCAPPWHAYFHATGAHNTIEVDGADQMIKGPRFLWLRWTRSHVNRFHNTPDHRLAYFEGEHYGYTRLAGKVIHRRAICRLDDFFVIIDDVLGAGVHDVTLRWRVCDTHWEAADGGWQTTTEDAKVTLQTQAPRGFAAQLLCGQEKPAPEGWESLYYAQRQPVPVIRISGRTALPVRLVTTVMPSDMAESPRVISVGTPQTPLLLNGISDTELGRQTTTVSGGRVCHTAQNQ